MAGKTTLIEIAQAAGVSLSTVDRVVNRRGGVSSAAEARVLEWASRLDLDRRIFRRHLRSLRVAVMMQSPRNPFYKGLRAAFLGINSNRTHLGIQFFFHYIDVNDIAATAGQFREVARSYDALIVTCPDDARLADALQVISRRVPVVTLVTDVPNSGRIAYVGPDNRQMGRVAGELMGRFLGQSGGDVVIVLGMQRMSGHEEREMGFRSVLRERFPVCTIVASLESGEDQERAGDVVYRALRRHADVRGLYNVSAGNLAIAKAIESLGLEHKIIIVTHEITPERRQLLRDGILDVVIDQNPKLEAQRVLDVLGRHFKRADHDLHFENYTPFDIFIRENCPASEIST